MIPTGTVLSRGALRRVLQSLLIAERAAARGRRGASPSSAERLPALWPDDLGLSDRAGSSLGCDSLEMLQLAAAANEMFHLYEGGDEADLLTADTIGAWLDHIETAWGRGVSHVTFLTSGSTGLPRRCRHAFAHLAVEAGFLAQTFADRRRIVALVPAHHIYGFIVTALLPDRLGVEVWPAERSSPGELARGLRPGDLVVTFPERWTWLERSLPEWPSDVVGVTSTAPCPPGLAAALRHRGLASLVEIYGSSETAGIAWRNDPTAPYRLMPHWDPAAGDEAARPFLVHQSGLRAAMPDRVATRDGRFFRLAGRIDGAVQVGGVNVDADRVATLLVARAGVRSAAVRLMRPEQGSRLKAFIVPEADLDLGDLETGLVAWAADHLPAAERPTAFTFGEHLPRSALGKPADW